MTPSLRLERTHPVLVPPIVISVSENPVTLREKVTVNPISEVRETVDTGEKNSMVGAVVTAAAGVVIESILLAIIPISP